uniref:Small glutamine-rich tetratricopeptide repeat-containing protein alpha n=1 Tax=Lygus hesperus TaxID=30085 RepID=A0A0A9WFW2_LYGHE
MEQGEDKKRLMISILHHLRGELRSGHLDSEQTEGLEVAIQCLESIYGVHDGLLVEPSLLEIYKSFLITSIVNKPDASQEDKANAEKLKTDGNTAMNNGLFNEAIELYTKAINYDPKNAVYYCNRAAAHSKLRNHQQAIVDCKIAIEIDPSYSKAYGRLGLAYCGLDDYNNALTNYKRAYDLEPSNEGYKKNYDLAKMKVKENKDTVSEDGSVGNPGVARNSGSVPPTAPPNPMDFSGLFSNPQLLNIASHMLLDPQLQNMMASFMNEGAQANAQSNNPAPAPEAPAPGTGAPQGGFGDLLMMGHRLAQRMHQENPQFIEELRNTLSTAERTMTPPEDQQGTPPPHDKKQ